MNNSSANNVLLKSLQVTTTQSSPKRSYQDDQSTSFQQRFQDVHESTHARAGKASKPDPKKNAVIDNPKPANDLEKNRSVSSKRADENHLPEKLERANTKADVKDKCAKQNAEIEAESSGESTSSESAKNSMKKNGKNVEDDEQNNDLFNPAVIPAALKDVSLSADATAATNGKSVIESGFNLAPALTKGEATSFISDSEEFTSAVVDTGRSSDQPVLSDSDKLTMELINDPNQEIPSQLAQSTQTLATDAVEQSAITVAAGEVTAPKIPAAQSSASASGDEESQIGDDETDAVSISSITENAVKKTPQTADSQMQTAESGPQQNKLLDPKTTFEKTLQNLVQPDARGKDDNSLQILPAATTSANSASSTLDSLMRFGNTSTPAARSFVVQTAVPVPVGQPQWSQAVGEKVLWFAAQNISSAEINLNPEHLGPVQVKVTVNQDQTSVNFTSHHAVVREVLDQNLGRLRDMFSEQGLNLVNVDVSDKSFSRQQGEAQHQNGQGARKESSVEEETPVAVSLIKHQRLVDHYA